MKQEEVMAPPDRKVSTPADPGSAIRELIRGHEMAVRLGALLRRSSSGDGGRDEAGALAEEVLTSLSKALQALDSGETSEVCRAAAAVASSLCSDDRRSAASSGKRKARTAADCRGGQRRRSHSYMRVVQSKTTDDGHTWRKYGQKGIQSATHPRSYFRCTHKHDQGCQAIRQVQKSEDDPSTFVITYMGEHTCTNAANLGQPGAGRAAGEPFLITFGDSAVAMVGGPPAPEPTFVGPVPPRQESADDDALSGLSRNDSSSEYLMLPGLAGLDGSVLLPAASGGASDIGDATSGLHSSCVSPSSLDMDMAVDSFQFEEYILNLDQDDDLSFTFSLS